MGADASRILAGLAAAVDGLPDLDVHTLIRDGRLAILRDVETVMRRIPAATHGLVNELAAGHITAHAGCGGAGADLRADR